jgi:hypothetical protein
LAAGGGFTKVRAGAKVENPHKLSGEPRPRLPLLCRMKKKNYISQKKRGSELPRLQGLRPVSRISLPSFPFEFSVEQASNRMIDIRGLIKVLKQIQLSFIVSFSNTKL